MKWDYMIAHYPKFNEWAIMRVSEDGGEMRWLNTNDEWTRDKKAARRFYHKETVEGALALCRIKCLKEEDIPKPKQEKQSWSEL